ncbi:MAG: type II secretion system protein, partial [Bacilli bacterium]|nr:type II secretion system protein [Bacilli bacterium]MBO6194944.1 type II secretion system protein [Bacilli bacterium]
MKKKKGFTLIELLAAVVIITVLLVLSAPKVIDIVEKADKAAFENDVKTMVATAKLQYEVKDADDFYSEENKIDDDEYEGVKLPELPAYEFYNSKQVNEKYKLNVKGVKLPKSGGLYVVAGINRVEETHEFIEYDNDNVQIYVDNLISNNGKWCAKTNDNNPEEIEIGKTSDPSMNCNASGHAGDTSVCRVDAYKKRGRVMNYEINSLCDFYALANDYYEPVQLKQQLDTETNTSKKAEIKKKLDDAEKRLASYKQKGINLMVDLDMSETYSETAKDGNGRSISEFAMVGNAQYPFNAKFNGGAHTIKNLNLTKSQDNVGIFGTTNSSAEIYGLILENNSIRGNSFTGGLIGRDYSSKVYEIQVNSGNVYGADHVGGLVGWHDDTAAERNNHHNILVKDVTVNGNGYVSPITYYGEVNSIIEKSTVTNRDTYWNRWTATNGNYTSYINVIRNESPYNAYDERDLGDINFYENMGMDTWIGNDNDNSGYYWDYENDTDKNIVLKKVSKDPITFNLSGNGTPSDPYVIKTWKDWKEVSSRLDTSAYYILNNDLDFTDKQFYMLGSRLNQMNAFNIEGKNKVISGVEINARNVAYVGISGNAKESKIYGLNLSDNSIAGNSYTGGLIGYDNGCTVYEIQINNGYVYGVDHVGGLVGWHDDTVAERNKHHNILVKDVTVDGNGYVSPITYYGEVNSIIEKATVTNRDTYWSRWNATNGDYTSYRDVIRNGDPYNAYDERDLGDINFYENMGMD